MYLKYKRGVFQIMLPSV